MSLSRTLNALETIIDIQRETANRALADIERLRELKHKALSDPQTFIDNISQELDDPAFQIHTLNDENELDQIDWRLFHGVDPKFIHDVPIPSLVHRPSEDIPSTSSAGTELRSIIDSFKPLIASLPPELRDNVLEDEQERAEELLRRDNKERPKKKRRVDRGKLAKPTTNDAMPHRTFGEESSPASTLVNPSSSSATPPPKQRAELFKVPWTTHEQHMLERCLLEIPETERFRWLKISKAMGGTRTPRQVASRVQKYNLKLKKFGLG